MDKTQLDALFSKLLATLNNGPLITDKIGTIEDIFTAMRVSIERLNVTVEEQTETSMRLLKERDMFYNEKTTWMKVAELNGKEIQDLKSKLNG